MIGFSFKNKEKEKKTKQNLVYNPAELKFSILTKKMIQIFLACIQIIFIPWDEYQKIYGYFLCWSIKFLLIFNFCNIKILDKVIF